MSHHWHTNADDSPKTHRRPRTCESCKDNPKGACLLPFRMLRKVRQIAQFERWIDGGVQHRKTRRVRW